MWAKENMSRPNHILDVTNTLSERYFVSGQTESCKKREMKSTLAASVRKTLAIEKWSCVRQHQNWTIVFLRTQSQTGLTEKTSRKKKCWGGDVVVYDSSNKHERRIWIAETAEWIPRESVRKVKEIKRRAPEEKSHKYRPQKLSLNGVLASP